MASTSTWQRPAESGAARRPSGPPALRKLPPPPLKLSDEPDDWVADEPSVYRVIIGELQRFKERMKMHPVPVLFLALLMTAGVVWKFTRKPPIHTARVILRISEGALSTYRGSLMPRNALKDYIYSFALTDQLLLEKIIGEHQLFQEEMELKGADLALGELRDGLAIDVFHNYFHYNRNYEQTPRSLRLAIVYMHEDPEFAYKLALLLAELVVASESQKRLEEVRFAARNAREALDAAEAAYAAREEERARLRAEIVEAEEDDDGVTAALARVEARSLYARQRLADRELVGLRNEVEEIEFARMLEEESMGLVFEYAGQVRPVEIPPPGPVMLGLVALVCFCIFVPVCAIGIGTIDARVQNLEDVSRLGLPVVGHVPAFDGDVTASLRRRGALARRGPLALLGLTRSRRVRRSRGRNRVA